MAVVLLVGAGLLGRSFARLLAVDLGFESASIQTFRVTLPDSKYPQPLQRQEFFDTLLARIATHPSVESVGGNNGLPLTRLAYGISTSSVDGRTLSDDEQNGLTLQIRLVTPDYFKTMGIAIPRGRAFLPTDRTGTGPVVISTRPRRSVCGRRSIRWDMSCASGRDWASAASRPAER